MSTAARYSGWSGTPSYRPSSTSSPGLTPSGGIDGGAERVARQEHEPGLEQGQVAEAARVVALGDLDQARQDRGAQVALLLADRVGQLEGLARRPFGGHAEGVIGGLGDERVRQDLGESGVGQGLDQAAALLLDAGQAAARRRHRQGRRDLVVADQPGDLLGEVFLGFEVVAPARGGHRVAAVVLRNDGAEVLERGDDLFLGEVDADPCCGEACRQFDGDGVRRGPDVGPGLVGGAAGEFDQQVHDALGGDVGHLPVHAAFEALGRLGRQLVAAAGAGDGHFVEVRGLDQDVRGGVATPRWRRRPSRRRCRWRRNRR